MQQGSEGLGYRFTVEQRQSVQAAVDRLTSTLDVSLRLSFGSAQGFDGVTVSLVDDGLHTHGVLVHFQSARDGARVLWFGALDGQGEPVGGDGSYRVFAQALAQAEAFALGVIRTLQDRRAREASESARARETPPSVAVTAPRNGAPPRDETFRGNILTNQEVSIVNAFAEGMGHCARTRGFARFLEAQIGVLSIALGVLDLEENPVLLGTAVVVADDKGGYECSMRGVNNLPLPWSERHTRISAALTEARPYFEHMATALGKRLRPGLLGRLRSGLGC